MHYITPTSVDSSQYNPTFSYTNPDHVIHTNPADPQYIQQFNGTPTTPPAGYPSPANAKGNSQDYSPRGSQKRSERDEPLEEGLVMHIREAFLPFNDPSPATRASKRYVLLK